MLKNMCKRTQFYTHAGMLMRTRNCHVLGSVQSSVLGRECSQNAATYARVAHGDVGIDEDDAICRSIRLANDECACTLAQVQAGVGLRKARVPHHIRFNHWACDICDT
jgi:hypothetical protein